ncbi:MAG: AgmX/PglI C-terminal domain-containing protein [Myxococcaceae bacterium]|nr:AgmX/PglI C-terminal domain-containing protein [Myxococcaceae bacterium]
MAEHLSEEEIDSVARGGARPAHLTVCIECARRVRAATGRVKLLAGFRKHTLSDEALARVEHRVMEQVQQPVTVRWPLWGWGLLGVAAGLLLALYVAQPVKRAPAQTVVKAPKLMPVWRAVSFAAYRVEGDVTVNGVELVAGVQLKPGVSFTVSSGAAWLSSVPQGVVVKTTASGVVGGKTQLDMGSDGEWAMEVKSTQAHVFYSEPVWLSATDAVFRVVKTAAQVVVEVKRGTVMVSEDASFAKAQRVEAPHSWSLPPGAVPVAGEWEAPVAAKGEGAEVLNVNGLPQGSMVQIGDGGFVPGPLSALLPLGAYDVGVRFPGESRVMRSKVELKVGGTSFVPPKPLKQVLPENSAAIASIPEVVASRRPSLQPCVEKWLKNDAQASAHIEIELAISPLGKVRRAAVVQGQVPAVVQQCLLRTVRGWPFPRLGGAEDTVVTLPLVLVRSGN